MKPMGRLEFASPREAWGGEATAFTPLLADGEMLAYLGEETGIGPLALVETEHTTAGNRQLDILAETADGRRVAIENQYGVHDHDHLTRGLAYAVATESRALVVIAEDHRDEFIAVADYLNEVGTLHDDVGIRVWLVKVRAVRRVGDELWSPEFVVQAEPNEWAATVRRDSTPELSSLEDFYSKATDRGGLEWSDSARQVIEAWLDRPNASEFHNTKSTVSLYYPCPVYTTGVNLFQLDLNGNFHVCRQYIWQSSGVFDKEAEPVELDEQIRHRFPDAHWTEHAHFIGQRGVDPEAVASLADWLVEKFDAAIEAAG